MSETARQIRYIEQQLAAGRDPADERLLRDRLRDLKKQQETQRCTT
jgi:hypothetical protein